jgi:hypothetical protein
MLIPPNVSLGQRLEESDVTDAELKELAGLKQVRSLRLYEIS